MNWNSQFFTEIYTKFSTLRKKKRNKVTTNKQQQQRQQQKDAENNIRLDFRFSLFG